MHHTIILSAEIFETNTANTTLFVSCRGSQHSAQVMMNGKDHKARAARYCSAVSREYRGYLDGSPHAAATAAIMALDSANTAHSPASVPSFGFAVTIIETALAAATVPPPPPPTALTQAQATALRTELARIRGSGPTTIAAFEATRLERIRTIETQLDGAVIEPEPITEMVKFDAAQASQRRRDRKIR